MAEEFPEIIGITSPRLFGVLPRQWSCSGSPENQIFLCSDSAHEDLNNPSVLWFMLDFRPDLLKKAKKTNQLLALSKFSLESVHKSKKKKKKKAAFPSCPLPHANPSPRGGSWAGPGFTEGSRALLCSWRAGRAAPGVKCDSTAHLVCLSPCGWRSLALQSWWT